MVEIEDVFFKINSKEIINGVKFSIGKGIITGVLGKNGAGKTTLFRLIFGFYKPFKGNIHFNNRPLKKEDISFLETEQYFYPYMRGIEYLKLINNNFTQIDQWNEIFNLPLNELVDNYSTGMKKKLAFIGILLQDRPILLLDEPFNGVDLEGNEKMISILNHIKKDKIILISSHVLSLLTSLSDHIFVLEKGQIKDDFHRDQYEILKANLKNDIETNIKKTLDNLNP